jgi:uncharacterized protein YndB with AHSA1/START domain
MRAVTLAFLSSLLVASIARAEVVDSQAGGFTVRESRTIAAAPATVWATLVAPAGWWSSDHTFSHDARNLTLSPKVGGFWQESLPNGGGARHLVVVLADPPSTLRLEGALGPLQALGVAAHLTFKLAPEGGGTLITATYDAGGHAAGGLDKLAGPVDGVLDAQLGRLKARVETGAAP